MTWSRHQVDALLRVNREAAVNPSLDKVLEVIALEACHVTRASATSVILSEPGDRLRLGASVGLSANHIHFLEGPSMANGTSVSRLAAEAPEPIVIDDVRSDRRFGQLTPAFVRNLVEREGVKAVLSVPLMSGSRAFGVLNLYRNSPGPWLNVETELATSFAQHAAGAIDSARLIDSHRRQVDALERLVQVLRDQTHEYANRLHAVSGLLTLGEAQEAQSFLAQLMLIHHENHASVIEHIHHPVIAGLLVAQMGVSRQRGVDVKLDRRSKVETLPESIGTAEVVTIIANLIENAVEAVVQMPPSRRRASVRIIDGRRDFTIAVRDFGPGIEFGESESEILGRGKSSKDGHPGIGLALVAEAVASAHGAIDISSTARGTAFTVRLPRR